MGSSPLTRGIHSRIGTCTPATRLIPAHAGKTAPTRRPWCGSSAHPRSRGENCQLSGRSGQTWGSSPLTRGKRLRPVPRTPLPGLIPAHAGKTSCRSPGWPESAAHPRSRGENPSHSTTSYSSGGSSPLTRGKRDGLKAALPCARLIPAHAGKTRGCATRRGPSQAHPRSRGENSRTAGPTFTRSSSSPLTRGKHSHTARAPALHGLIPAHAGKTVLVHAPASYGTAHPRSRGENLRRRLSCGTQSGSSPLTRGKQLSDRRDVAVFGLIPAHAGKTTTSTTQAVRHAAHPRSRGENASAPDAISCGAGSSPLTRGKRCREVSFERANRLIPAHAGKTLRAARIARRHWAHPRSRGENKIVTMQTRDAPGSSPLTRGKHVAATSRSARARLIPAHAGKTAESARPACRAPAHPRSRGENLVLAAFRDEHDGSSPLTRGKPP